MLMSVKKQKLVVIGNGMAGIRVVEELIKLAPELYEITVFGAEPHPNYNRIMLSPVLAGEQKFEESCSMIGTGTPATTLPCTWGVKSLKLTA